MLTGGESHNCTFQIYKMKHIALWDCKQFSVYVTYSDNVRDFLNFIVGFFKGTTFVIQNTDSGEYTIFHCISLESRKFEFSRLTRDIVVIVNHALVIP